MPNIFDGFAGEGGAGVGYERAGFTVYGVDREARAVRRNPHHMYHGDIIDVLDRLLDGELVSFGGYLMGLRDFHAWHFSPPCQAYSIATAGNKAIRDNYDRLIAVIRAYAIEIHKRTGAPYVIENVEGARRELYNPVMLCGRMFNLVANDVDGKYLVLDRHRYFESNIMLTTPEHPAHGNEQVAGVYGGSRRAIRRMNETLIEVAPRDRHAARYERGGGYVPRSMSVRRALLGIDWMTGRGMEESIPPIYAEFIGKQLMEAING